MNGYRLVVMGIKYPSLDFHLKLNFVVNNSDSTYNKPRKLSGLIKLKLFVLDRYPFNSLADALAKLPYFLKLSSFPFFGFP